MSKIQVDSIEALDPNGPIYLPYGATIPSGAFLSINGGFSAGIVTASSHSGQNVSASGVITATSFNGNGSQLTNLPTITQGKSIAFTLIAG